MHSCGLSYMYGATKRVDCGITSLGQIECIVMD